MGQMKLLQPGLQHYVKRIRDGQPFTFVRYGDGEWSAILNDRRQRTGSGSHSLKLPAMQKALRQSLIGAHELVGRTPALRRSYVVAMRQTAMREAIRQWLTMRAPWLRWHDCTVFYKASKKGRLHPFVKAIRESDLPKVVVGPPWLRKLNGPAFKLAAFIEIPSRDCWRERESIIKRALDFGKPAIISISAGPPAKVFAWQLYQKIGQESFILDLGTLWDVYCGKRSRQYMKNMNAATIRRNLHGE